MGMKIAGIMLVVMVAMSSAFIWYYKDTQKRMQIMTENNAKLEIAVQTSEEAVQSLQRDYAAANAELGRVNTAFDAARQQNRELSNRLAEHELGMLAAEKPALVERIINNASEKAMRCFELLSGAELTESERNATNGKAFNSECPWLWSGSNTAN